MRAWPALILTFPSSAASGECTDGGTAAGTGTGTGTDGAFDDPMLSLPDRVSAVLDGLDVVAIEESSDEIWRVSFREPTARSRAARALDDLAGSGLRFDEVDVPDDDWARRSQAALGAIRVDAVIVAPPWDPTATVATPGALTVIVEPGMGFGSGHHATTRLCLRALQILAPQGRTVLDIGTGSGVLAIAAAMLGARSVLAIDVDPDALESARTNAALNNHPPALALRVADFRTERLPPADIVFANLTGAMLAASAADILACCARGGAAILSGITIEEAAGVVETYALRAAVEWQAEEDGWIGLVARP
ncbi:MAG: 50S ribosomal protein L11 methyltransferase [Acidobacteriota bacterium]